MFKFLHAADIHLDSPLRGLERYDTAPADRIRDATRRAFENLVELAIAERVDFVLLAGDLYDGDWQDYNTGLYLIRQMARLHEAGIPVFLIAGNHDARSRMTRRLRLPENVRTFSTDEPESHELKDLGVVVHGQGFATPAVTDDLSQRYPAAWSGHYNIGLLHTCAEGADGHDRYAPCTPQGLVAKGYDYWGLGHIHCRQTLSREPYIAFPGNPQGRHVRETGPKGCLLVSAGNGRPASVNFRRLDVVRWELCEVPAAQAENDEEIAEAAFDRLGRLLAEEESDRLLTVRVVVKGPCRRHDELLANPSRCAAEIRARAAEFGGDRLWIEQVKVQTEPLRTAAGLADGPLDELFAVLDELRGDELRLKEAAGLLSDLRVKLPPELLQADDAPAFDDPAWLRDLLDTAEALLRSRLHV